jgi:hypothetical protein
VRFLGTSPASSDARSLVFSLCAQLRRISAGAPAGVTAADGAASAAAAPAGLPPVPADLEGAAEYLRAALAGWRWGPLVLLLDGLDQLDDSDGGRRLGWLPLDGLAALVHLVVSTIPDQQSPAVGSPFRCLSILAERLQEPEPAAGRGLRHCAVGEGEAAAAAAGDDGNFVEVEALVGTEVLLAHLLRQHGRRATGAQMAVAVRAAERPGAPRTPLFAALLARQMAQWRSTDPPPELPGTVRAVLTDLFRRLEQSSGERLVRAAVAYITLARQGVSESELQELLSLDDAVLTDVYQWYEAGIYPCLPACLPQS